MPVIAEFGVSQQRWLACGITITTLSSCSNYCEVGRPNGPTPTIPTEYVLDKKSSVSIGDERDQGPR